MRGGCDGGVVAALVRAAWEVWRRLEWTFWREWNRQVSSLEGGGIGG